MLVFSNVLLCFVDSFVGAFGWWRDSDVANDRGGLCI